MVLYTLGLVSFLLFGALAIDVGYWYAQKAKMQMTMDAVAIGALGTITRGGSVASQETYIANAVTAIETANGYAAGQFTPTYHVTPTRGRIQWVDKVTLQGSQTLTTWMWHVFNVNTITLRGYVTAEDDANPFIGCSFMTQNSGSNTNFKGASNANRMVFDSYDSSKAPYNPVNDPYGWGSPSDGDQNVLCADGTFTFQGYTALYGSVGTYAQNVGTNGTGLTFTSRRTGMNYVSGDAASRRRIRGTIGTDMTVLQGIMPSEAGLTKYTTTCAAWPPNIATLNDNSTNITCTNIFSGPPYFDCERIVSGDTSNTTYGAFQNHGAPYPWPPTSKATVTISVKSGGTNIYVGEWDLRMRDYLWSAKEYVTVDIVDGSGVVAPANAVTLWVDDVNGKGIGLKLGGSLQFDPANPGTAQDLYVIANNANGPPITFGMTYGRATDNLYADICANNSKLTLPANLHYFGAFFVNSMADPPTDDFTYDEALGPVGLGSDPIMRGTHLMN